MDYSRIKLTFERFRGVSGWRTRGVGALAAIAVAGVLAVLPSASQAQGPGCRPLRVIFYAERDWIPLANALAANPSPCAAYYFSIPPLTSAKTQMRSGVAPVIRALGPNFHALAEVNVAAWQSWVASTGNSWNQAGMQARAEMNAAGFDVAAGDSWFVNEFSSAVRQGTGVSRQNMEALIQGLYEGDGTSPTQGVVAVVGIGQSTNPLSVYKANLESWLEDPGFWSAIGPDVSDFLQETYGDIRDYAVSGADVPTRISYLSQYLEHELALSSAAPPGVSAAQSFLASTYAPLANAAWAFSSGFGFTAESAPDMEDYIAAQIDAMRSYDASLGWSGDRIGFAWAPTNGLGESTSSFASDEASILSQLAASIDASADPSAPGAGACQAPWCTAVVPGAAFVPGWSGFSTWTPTTVNFASAAVSVPAGSPSAAITLAPEIGGVVTSLPVATDVGVTSSSPSGTLSTSPQGPWSSTLDLTIPAGSTSTTLYMLDTQQGTPTLSAASGGHTSQQVETVTAPVVTISSVAPLSGVAGTTVTITGGGFQGATAVTFNGTPASFTVVSPSEITATVPAGAATGPVAVTTPAGTATSSVSFEISPLSISTSGTTATVDEGSAATPLDPGLTITDSSSATLSGATVTISSGYVAGDTLSAATAGPPITASYANGVLTLSGDAPVGAYVSVLASVAFTSTSSVSGPRTVTWEAEDVGGATGEATSSFTFLALPGAPGAVSATAADGQATVSFTPAPASPDTPATSYYTVTASPGGATATGQGSPVTVTGLSDGTSYTFTVRATSAVGTGPASEASNAVTPTAPAPAPGSNGSGGGGGGGGGGPGGGGGTGAVPVAIQPASLNPSAPLAPPLPARSISQTPKATSPPPAASTLVPTLTVASIVAVDLAAKRPTLAFTVKVSKKGRFVFSLRTSKGKTVASWSLELKPGTHKLALLVPLKARHAGRDTLRIAETGRTKPITRQVILRR